MTSGLIIQFAASLGKIGCPYCHSTSLSPVLRCDLSSGGPCELAGECEHCSAKFDIGDVETMGGLYAQTERVLTSLVCSCGEYLHVEFVCNLVTGNWSLVAACSQCGSERPVLPRRA